MNWFTIKNADKQEGELFIYGEITDDSFFDSDVSSNFVRQELSKIKAKVLNVYINSPGGSVFTGLTIYNQLKRFPGRVNAFIDGIAASIASVIAIASDSVSISPQSMFMIHDPSAVAVGTSEDLMKTAQVLDKTKEILVDAYVKKTNLNGEKISDMMHQETWFTGTEAVSMGFADSLTSENVIVENKGGAIIVNGVSIDLKRFKNFNKFSPVNKSKDIDYIDDLQKRKEQILSLKKGV